MNIDGKTMFYVFYVLVLFFIQGPNIFSSCAMYEQRILGKSSSLPDELSPWLTSM